MIHSDRGVQYASKDFRLQLKQFGATQSKSRSGDCWDMVAESFFHTLKTQLTHHQRYKTMEQLEGELFCTLKSITTGEESTQRMDTLLLQCSKNYFTEKEN